MKLIIRQPNSSKNWSKIINIYTSFNWIKMIINLFKILLKLLNKFIKINTFFNVKLKTTPIILNVIKLIYCGKFLCSRVWSTINLSYNLPPNDVKCKFCSVELCSLRSNFENWELSDSLLTKVDLPDQKIFIRLQKKKVCYHRRPSLIN